MTLRHKQGVTQGDFFHFLNFFFMIIVYKIFPPLSSEKIGSS